MTHAAIRTDQLGRTYRRSRKRRTPAQPIGDLIALDGVSLEVRPGELFGLLGPNGAGKTTLIKILTTLLAPTSGRAWIDGRDVVGDAKAIRPFINMVSGGESCGYGVLNVRENLWLFTQLYGVPDKLAMERIERMLGIVGLTDKAYTKVSHLSTGQRQKMNFCRGFLTDPKVLFLDEPTLGLDVNAARSIRKFVKDWLAEKPDRTLLLTTHYMTEADELCDRVAIIDQGKVLACDSPSSLKRQVQRYPMYQIALAPTEKATPDMSSMPGVHQSTLTPTATELELKVSLIDESVIGNVVQQIVSNGGRILSLKKVEPTLEDVFIEHVGHGLNDKEATS